MGGVVGGSSTAVGAAVGLAYEKLYHHEDSLETCYLVHFLNCKEGTCGTWLGD